MAEQRDGVPWAEDMEMGGSPPRTFRLPPPREGSRCLKMTVLRRTVWEEQLLLGMQGSAFRGVQ